MNNFLLFLQWVATPVNDMYADAVLSAILQAEAIGGSVSKTIPLPALKMDRSHFKVIIYFIYNNLYFELVLRSTDLILDHIFCRNV